MKFIVNNEDTGSLDIFGGPISEENAFFTTNSSALEGEPGLAELAIGQKQRRQGNTGDSKRARPNARYGSSSGDPHQRPTVYAVWRVE